MSSSAEIIQWQGSLLNPVEYAFGARPTKLTPPVEWCEGWLFVCIPTVEDSHYVGGRMDHFAFDFNAE